MTYSTQAQIVIACGGQARYDELFDFDADGVADLDVLAQAQQYADEWVKSYVSRRYSTEPPPTFVQMLSADEAVYYARKYKPSLGLTSADTEQRAERIKTLENLRDGAQQPADPVPPPSSFGNKARFVENDSPLSRRRSRGVLW